MVKNLWRMVSNAEELWFMVIHGEQWWLMVINGEEWWRMAKNGEEWSGMEKNAEEWWIVWIVWIEKNKSQRNLDLSDNTVSPRKPMVYHQLPHCLIAIFVRVPFSNTPPNLQMDHHFWWLKLQVSKWHLLFRFLNPSIVDQKPVFPG